MVAVSLAYSYFPCATTCFTDSIVQDGEIAYRIMFVIMSIIGFRSSHGKFVQALLLSYALGTNCYDFDTILPQMSESRDEAALVLIASITEVPVRR
jgi:hypothetical protein